MTQIGNRPVEPPVSMPNDGNQYMWDEENTEWTLVNN